MGLASVDACASHNISTSKGRAACTADAKNACSIHFGFDYSDSFCASFKASNAYTTSTLGYAYTTSSCKRE